MNKKKLIKLRCKAWGITEDEYYCNQCSDFSLKDMARAYRRGKNKGRADLEKENAELREELNYAETHCLFHSDCPTQKENAELKENLEPLRLKVEALAGDIPWSELKDKGEVIGRLTKAKGIIKKFSEFVNNEIEYDSENPQEYTNLWNKLCEEAEQFLSEVEK